MRPDSPDGELYQAMGIESDLAQAGQNLFALRKELMANHSAKDLAIFAPTLKAAHIKAAQYHQFAQTLTNSQLQHSIETLADEENCRLELFSPRSE